MLVPVGNLGVCESVISDSVEFESPSVNILGVNGVSVNLRTFEGSNRMVNVSERIVMVLDGQ